MQSAQGSVLCRRIINLFVVDILFYLRLGVTVVVRLA